MMLDIQASSVYVRIEEGWDVWVAHVHAVCYSPRPYRWMRLASTQKEEGQNGDKEACNVQQHRRRLRNRV